MSKQTPQPYGLSLEEYRARYRHLMDFARDSFGWDAKRFRLECSGLASYFMTCGETEPEAWVSAAIEVMTYHSEG